MSEGAAISYVPLGGKAIGAPHTPGKSNTCWKTLAEKDEEPRYDQEATWTVYDDCGFDQVENFHPTFCIFREEHTRVKDIIYKLNSRRLSYTRADNLHFSNHLFLYKDPEEVKKEPKPIHEHAKPDNRKVVA